MLSIKKQIKAELKRQKLSVPVLARRVECNEQTIYNYLTGRTNGIRADILERILKTLGGSVGFDR